MATIDIILNVLGIYSLLLCIVGTVGNIFNLFIILKTDLKKTKTFVFLAFLSVTDTLSMYWWDLDHFLTPFFQIDRQNESNLWCKINTFIQESVLFASAFFLVKQSFYETVTLNFIRYIFNLKVLISFDRYLSVRISTWNTVYFTTKRAKIASIILILAVMLLNLNILFTFGVDIVVNGTEIIQCYSTPLDPTSKWMDVWGTVSYKCTLIIIFYNIFNYSAR